MSKHTPGPWMANVGHGGQNLSVVAGDVSVIGGCGCCGSPFMDGPAQANARLIAAAPELLEALQLIVKTCAFQRGESPTFDVAIAAIAKATGEQQ